MQIFVGNLSFASTGADIKKLFERFGSVASVTLLMNKNGRKSRGFCFVEMSDEHSARAAIAGLDSREFMGRPLKVMAARPKPVKEPVVEEKRETRFRAVAETRYAPRREIFKEEARFKPKPVAEKSSRFKGGRRSSSYLRRATGRADEQFQVTQASTGKPWQKSSGHAKPWRKTEGRSKPKPWEKSERPDKPWKKAEGHAKPWEKSERPDKPWKKTEGHAKSWEKPGERAKPWQKREDRSKPWKKAEGSSKPWKKSEGQAKPWKKSEGPSKPWKKTEGSSKPRKKTEGPSKPWKKSGDKPWRKSSSPARKSRSSTRQRQ